VYRSRAKHQLLTAICCEVAKNVFVVLSERCHVLKASQVPQENALAIAVRSAELIELVAGVELGLR
jgi:hypothetical protein